MKVYRDSCTIRYERVGLGLLIYLPNARSTDIRNVDEAPRIEQLSFFGGKSEEGSEIEVAMHYYLNRIRRWNPSLPWGFAEVDNFSIAAIRS